MLSAQSLAQTRPVPVERTPPQLADPDLPKTPPTLPVINTTDHCAMGQASWKTAPSWSEVVDQNLAYFQSLGMSAPAPGSAVVGVPSLDDPADNLGISDSLNNVISLLTNVQTALESPGVVAGSQAVGSGSVICRSQPDHNGDQWGKRIDNVDFCAARTTCEGVNFSTLVPATASNPNPGPFAVHPNNLPPINVATSPDVDDAEGEKFIWIPTDVKFLQKLEVNGENIFEAPPQDYFAFPQQLGPDDTKRPSLKFIEIVDGWTQFKQASFAADIANAVGGVKQKVGEYQEAWEDFSSHVNRYAEGYHLGAYDTMRPALHTCVGYYGDATENRAFNLFDGALSMGAKYRSFHLDALNAAQFRTGGALLELNAIPIDLVATPELNLQVPGLNPWNCDAPMGIDASGLAGAFCPVSTGFTPPQFCSSAQYLSPSNIDPDDPAASDGFSVGMMTDFYPVYFDGEVKWPRTVDVPLSFNPDGTPRKTERVRLESDEPSYAVMSGGLVLGYDLQTDPYPKDLGEPFTVGPVMGQLRWGLDYGIQWKHDSNALFEDITASLDALSASQLAAIITRDDKGMQAGDLTADNLVGAYTNPSVFLSLGYFLADPAERFTLDLGLDLGLHVDIAPTTYAGIADMNMALRDALAEVNANAGQGLECSPTLADEAVKVIEYCTSDAFRPYNSPLDNGLRKLSEEVPLSGSDVVYACNDISTDTYDYADIPRVKSCTDYGYCNSPNGNAGLVQDWNAQPSTDCKTEFVQYECAAFYKTEITGWDGPGCSPLLGGAGYPSAPGGMCELPDPVAAYPVEGTCSGGNVCDGGACVPSCSTDLDCAVGGSSAGAGGELVCNVSAGVCEANGGLPFAEQIAWSAVTQAPGDPKHAVWSHAANKLEAKADFSAGLSVKFDYAILGNMRTIIDREINDAWLLASAGVFDYDIGLVAGYDNSCASQIGEVDIVQTSTPLPRASALTDGMASEDMIAVCGDTLPIDVADDADVEASLPTDEAILGGFVDTYEATEAYAEVAWDEYSDDICINGQSWMSFMEGLEDSEGAPGPSVDVLVGGQSTDWDDIEREILEQSGCLSPSKFGAQSLALASVLGVDADGNIDLAAHLSVPGGGFGLSNIAASATGAPGFNSWYGQVADCVDAFIGSGAVEAEFELGPCPGEDGVVDVDYELPGPCPPGTVPTGTAGGGAIGCAPPDASTSLGEAPTRPQAAEPAGRETGEPESGARERDAKPVRGFLDRFRKKD